MGNFPQYKEKLYTCYMLKHIKTGKVYIGISSSFGTRISNHLLDLYGNRHSNYLLQKDFNDDNDISVKMLETFIPKERRSERETYWCGLYKGYDEQHGYNCIDKQLKKAFCESEQGVK